MSTDKNRLMILGPTASGKTELACRVAGEWGAEIISVDARQCYNRIDIGTAKPDPEVLQEVPHYNISVLNLRQGDSVVSFLERAGKWENQIRKNGRHVIYAGGSTLHLRGVLQPMDDLPDSSPVNISSLKAKEKSNGIGHLYSKLEEVDPEYASEMDGFNRQRIMRALDVWMQTGRPFSSFHKSKEVTPPGDMQVFGLYWPRKLLHERINQRVDRMIEKGLVDEMQQILDDGYEPELQSLQTVGYRDVIRYLRGETAYDQMIADIKTQTRRYAKRQITWFRRWPFINWLDASEMEMEKMVEVIKQGLAADLNKG
jgi:tRNA dimethylallyltransferase